jgi:hypothetical protein
MLLKHDLSDICLLTRSKAVVDSAQQTRQASVLRDMLNSGGFLFSGRAT